VPYSKGMEPFERVRIELATRKLIVMMLGVMTVLVGAVTIMTGAPAFIEDVFSPWSRVVLGALAFIPGLIVAITNTFNDRTRCIWWLQLFGLSGIAAWFAFMCGSYTWYTLAQGITFVRIGQPLDSEQAGRAYVPLIYLVLLIMSLIPLITMIRVGRPTR
jgi:hypothetical protein